MERPPHDAVSREREDQPLRLKDIGVTVFINPRKLTEYCLDPDSPKGRYKATLFKTLLGYTKENAGILKRQLEAKALTEPATYQGEDRYGERYQVDIPVEGESGQLKIVKTVWLVLFGTTQARLVTLYIKKR